MRMAVLTAFFFLSLPSLYGITGAEVEAKKLNRSGLMELAKGNPGRASVFFRMALQRDPDKKHYYNNMAVSLMKTGSYNEAEKYLLKGISIDSNYTKALANMAVVLFHQRRFYESYNYYMRSKKSDPVYADKRFKKERVLRKLRDISSGNPEDDEVKKIINHLGKE
jgi:Tfp pilus assembly protein PilF